jgi:hypothetical protein
MITMNSRNVPWQDPTMPLDELMTALGYSEPHTRYERLSAVRQRAVAINTLSHSVFRRIQLNTLHVPLG